MSLIFFMTAHVYAQDICAETPSCCIDGCCINGRYFYAKAFAGANFLQNTEITDNKSEYHTGYIFAGSLGYGWSNGLRLEAEYAFRRNDICKIHFYQEGSSKSGYFQTSSYMANLFWNIPVSSWGCSFWNILPYIGAGIGYDFQQMQSSNSRIEFDQNWLHLSWQLMTGFSYPVFCNTEVVLEYKFHQGGCYFNNHAIGLGFVYKFGRRA